MVSADAICNPDSFREEARWQRVCAVCGRGGPFQAHHVVYEQILRREFHLSGNALYNPRNALRLCLESGENCHHRHHDRIRVVRTTELMVHNIAYAFQIMGPFASDWLRRYYDDSVPDTRIIQLELTHG